MYNNNSSLSRTPYAAKPYQSSKILSYVDTILQKSKTNFSHQTHDPMSPPQFVRFLSSQPTESLSQIQKSQSLHYNLLSNQEQQKADKKSPEKIIVKDEPVLIKERVLQTPVQEEKKVQQIDRQIEIKQNVEIKPICPLIPLMPNLVNVAKKHDNNYENPKARKQEERYKNFKILKKLGSGIYSSVFLAKHILTGFLVALKVINKAQMIREQMESQLAWEIKIQYLLEHPNIAKLYTFFQTSTEIILVLEYCPHGQLHEHLLKQPNFRFTEREAAIYVQQVTFALMFLHQNDVIHRDIKPENILLNFGQAKLADFSFCIYSPHEYRQTQCGTLLYACPEVLQGEMYDKKSDMWGLGVLSYELCFGVPPWKESQQEKIQLAQFVVPSAASRELKDFIENLVKRLSRDRMSAKQAYNHIWLQQTQQSMPFFLRRNEALFK